MSGVAQAYLDRFAEVEAGLPGSDLAWLRHRRARAIEAFGAHGLPSTRVEDWKYTNLRPLEKTVYKLAQGGPNGIDDARLARLAPDPGPCFRLVFVNGGYRADLSAPEVLAAGVTITPLAEALKERPDLIEANLDLEADVQGVRALNAAFMSDGAVVHLAAGTILEHPLHLVFVTLAEDAPTLSHAFNLVVAEPGARASIVETRAVTLSSPCSMATGSPASTGPVSVRKARASHVFPAVILTATGKRAILFATGWASPTVWPDLVRRNLAAWRMNAHRPCFMTDGMSRPAGP